jgi:peptidoglycan/xylan/chitin deacetylase (PgdA/CDA1 family)
MIDLRRIGWRVLDGMAFVADCAWSVCKRPRDVETPHAVAVYFHAILDHQRDNLVDPQEGMTASFLRTFIRAMKASGYTFVTPDQLQDPARPAGNLALLTSDDGYRSVETLLPILEEEGAPLTVFLTTDCSSRDGIYWWDQIHVAGAGGSALMTRLKRDVRSRAERDGVLRALGIDPLERAYSDSHRLLSPSDITRLAASPLFCFGNHSRSHLSLPQVAASELDDEVEGARHVIEEWTGREVRHFAFPYGDHDERTVRYLANQGYRTLFTIVPGQVPARRWPGCRVDAGGGSEDRAEGARGPARVERRGHARRSTRFGPVAGRRRLPRARGE